MLHGFLLVSLICTCAEAIKEYIAPVVPAENWANKELYHKDMMDGVPIKQRMKNLERGRYKLTDIQPEIIYPEPHKDPVSGKIIIENNLLYNKDLREYGAVQTKKWIQQGKYNLTPEELKKEYERIKKEFEYKRSLL